MKFVPRMLSVDLHVKTVPLFQLAEQTRKCLKVEYLGPIEYDFQKSHVTGPWDHMISVFCTKKNISCLCTFNVTVRYAVYKRKFPPSLPPVVLNSIYLGEFSTVACPPSVRRLLIGCPQAKEDQTPGYG